MDDILHTVMSDIPPDDEGTPDEAAIPEVGWEDDEDSGVDDEDPELDKEV